MKQGKLLILVGISGSGKSTFAHKLWADAPNDTTIVNRDKIRELLFGYTEESVNDYYSRNDISSQEKKVTRYEDTLINDALNHGNLVIVDATHLERKYLERYKYWNVPTEIKFFPIDPKVATIRMVDRERQVSKEVINKQYSRYTNLANSLAKNPIDFTPVTFNNDKSNRRCFIFDIDGTLAHKGDRNPYDWAKVGEDTLDFPTALVAEKIFESWDSDIIICTGRDGVCIEETQEWLEDNSIPYDNIYIREKGDMRPDWVIKEEMWREIAEDYYIVGMFDDRLQVVRRARALGLKVFNVAYNNF